VGNLDHEQQDEPQREPNGRWLPGRSPNPNGRAERRRRIVARAKVLADDHGGWDQLNEAQRCMLLKASELMAAKATYRNDPVRIANAVGRLLRLGKPPRRAGSTTRIVA
jgi:hypothetical protein